MAAADFPQDYSFRRYLQAKRSVDARAFNQRVWGAFVAHLNELEDRQIRLVELGAGIGSMAERILAALPGKQPAYTLLDQDGELLAEAQRRLAGSPAQLEFLASDAPHWLEGQGGSQPHAFIAHAFMDLVDIPSTLDLMRKRLASGGLLYLPINFDGVTAFEPPLDAKFEADLIARYHASMQGEGRPGSSRSGRELLRELPAQGFEVLESARSDWLVAPSANRYQEDEAYFLAHILHFFESELTQDAELDQARFSKWLAQRQGQIKAGELTYRTQQLDILARKA